MDEEQDHKATKCPNARARGVAKKKREKWFGKKDQIRKGRSEEACIVQSNVKSANEAKEGQLSVAFASFLDSVDVQLITAHVSDSFSFLALPHAVQFWERLHMKRCLWQWLKVQLELYEDELVEAKTWKLCRLDDSDSALRSLDDPVCSIEPFVKPKLVFVCFYCAPTNCSK